MNRFLTFIFAFMCIALVCAQTDGSKRKPKQASVQQSSAQKSRLQKTKASKKASYRNGVLNVNGVNYEMVNVQAGTCTMGAIYVMKDSWHGEKPARQITITNDYYIGKTEVTQALWKAVMGDNPSRFKEDDRPVECVSWDDCQLFISKLNSQTGQEFRLPTETEWEFAACGGNKSKHYLYSGSNMLNDVAWYYNNSGEETHPVATKRSNELGIYDMSGNVFEWCHDSYDSDAKFNLIGSVSVAGRVIRGGSWTDDASYCQSSCRFSCDPGLTEFCLGFRLALSE